MPEFSFTVAQIFGDHMVLQRDKPVKIWGESFKPQAIRVFINGNEVASTKAAGGGWQVVLPPMGVCRDLAIKIAGEDEGEFFAFRDVAVGEVWIAGGQSNMEFPLEYDAEAQQVIPGASNPDIRFFDVPKVKFEGQAQEDDFSKVGFWRQLTPGNAPFYSAVGFYFANKLYERLQVPIGIVGCNWGGTVASTWVDEKYLKEDEALSIYWQEYQAGLEDLDLNAYILAERQGREAMKRPQVVNFMRYLMKRTPGPLLRPIVNAIVKSSTNYPLPLGPRSENRPGGLYHQMVRKIAGYAARGVIWYQGESDDPKAHLYARVFAAVIRCWREAWNDDLPFLFVQLAPYERWLGFSAINFPLLREQQDLVSKTVPGASMASIMDAGSRMDIHPKNKRPAGERLALLARGKVYGEEILCEAPEAAGARLENGRLVISFHHAGDGLHLKGRYLKSLELFADGRQVKDLKIAVLRDTVTVQANGVQSAKGLEIRYAYQNYAEVNLYNSAGLPAKPFRQIVESRI